MRLFLRPAVLATFLITLPLAAQNAQDQGMWRASSQNARTVTGDIALSGQKIAINFLTFTIVRTRALDKAELSGAFDAGADPTATGTLYRLEVRADQKFLHKNTLCGEEQTEWMATAVSGRTLRVIFFSGEKPPQLTLDAMNNSTNVCGSYSYSR